MTMMPMVKIMSGNKWIVQITTKVPMLRDGTVVPMLRDGTVVPMLRDGTVVPMLRDGTVDT
jgi:hypothetical protein